MAKKSKKVYLSDKAKKPLTNEEKVFVAAYIANGFNRQKAAKESGCTGADLYNAGSRILNRPNVALAIKEKGQDILSRYEVDGRNVLGELAKIAFSGAADILDDEGKLRRLTDINDFAIAGIESVEYQDLDEYIDGEKETIGRKVKVKLHNKIKALDLLGKNLKLWTDKVEHSGEVSIVIDEDDAKC